MSDQFEQRLRPLEFWLGKGQELLSYLLENNIKEVHKLLFELFNMFIDIHGNYYITFEPEFWKGKFNGWPKYLDKSTPKISKNLPKCNKYGLQTFIVNILLPVIDENGVILETDLYGVDGYYNITLYQKKSNTAVIIELKDCVDTPDDRFVASLYATKQIIDQEYATRFKLKSCENIYCIGIGCSGEKFTISPLGNVAKKHPKFIHDKLKSKLTGEFKFD